VEKVSEGAIRQALCWICERQADTTHHYRHKSGNKEKPNQIFPIIFSLTGEGRNPRVVVSQVCPSTEKGQ